MVATLNGVQDYITDVRRLLQDQQSDFRYPDQDLVDAFNQAILESNRIRADLWTFLYPPGLPSYTVNDLGSTNTPVPIEQNFRLAFVHGIVAHAYLRDQEDVEDKRAAEFMRIFYAMLGVRTAMGADPATSAFSTAPQQG